MPRLQRTQPRHGFSLVELTIVLVIMSVLAALAVPRYAGSLNRYSTEVAARRIMSDLLLARDQARLTCSPRVIAFNCKNNSYQITGETDLARATNTWTVNLDKAPYKVTLTKAEFGVGSTVTFTGYGTADQSGTIIVTCGAATLTITFDAVTGTASMQ